MSKITILGYRGYYLAILFETLSANKFSGTIDIIMNEDEKKEIAPFETDIPYQEIFYTDVKVPPESGYIFCTNKPSTKKFLYRFYEKIWHIKKENCYDLVHPSSVIASTAKFEPGVQIEPLSVISPYAKLGFGVNIGRNCSIGHHTIISDLCSIHLGSNIASRVEIGEETEIGPGTTIFTKVAVGRNTIIGGGSVVTRNMPSNVLAYGNPCRVIKSL